MITGTSVSYSSITIATELRLNRGMVSTLSTRLSTPESPSPSPGMATSVPDSYCLELELL